jgi:hypothetical protein
MIASMTHSPNPVPGWQANYGGESAGAKSCFRPNAISPGPRSGKLVVSIALDRIAGFFASDERQTRFDQRHRSAISWLALGQSA